MKRGMGIGEQKQAGILLRKLLTEKRLGRLVQEQGKSKTPIIWEKIMESDGNTTFISQKTLAVRRFHSKYGLTDWKHSELRKWLNTWFIQEAFSTIEQSLLHPILLDDSRLSDKVSLLNFENAKRMGKHLETKDIEIISVPNEPKSLAYGNTYMSVYGMDAASRITCNNAWWLRTNALDDLQSAMVVYYHGAIHKRGYKKHVASCGVRPIIRVSSSGSFFTEEAI